MQPKSATNATKCKSYYNKREKKLHFVGDQIFANTFRQSGSKAGNKFIKSSIFDMYWPGLGVIF